MLSDDRKSIFKIFSSLFFIILILYLIKFFFNQPVNIINNNSINWGMGWINGVSEYSGSEAQFILSNSNHISISGSSNSKSDQGLEISINNDIKTIDFNNKSYKEIKFELNSKKNKIKIRHYCTHFYDKCELKINKIIVNRKARIDPPPTNKKILSILGDSISTNYGLNNYSFILADKLGYELHNASILGSSLTMIEGQDSLMARYEKDLKNFNSNLIIIFIGTNDINRNIDIEKFRTDYSKMMKNIRKNNPNSKIFSIGILPRFDINKNITKSYSEIIKEISRENNTEYLDPSNWLNETDYSDDIHPSAEVQKLIAEKIYSGINSKK